MTDRPIIFSAPMVRALLDGRKTQTRRVIKKPAALDALAVFGPSFLSKAGNADLVGYAPGDRLWVRENYARVGDNEDDIHACPDLRVHAYYRADAVCPGHLRWRPSIHMPRWASRLTLHVEAVRAQRLQDISEEDVRAEGGLQLRSGRWVTAQGEQHFGLAHHTARGCFGRLWRDLHGPDAWAADPWVAAVTFRVERHNIDATPTTTTPTTEPTP
ncbi:hypothetical protein EOD42_09045 [Rhodovarius crocodyli]|uniref:ASCH domain-containing protein n=1 Tax=Rhodovarius crocodyli TaxID=1979269 RepID=A0A437MJS5_9PROT|nr:hypothetical protein [Rhodovarius crocodyli]RVT97924.1 hypothetical protein EOD42_09045 [Rhodovarius crocodyli]